MNRFRTTLLIAMLALSSPPGPSRPRSAMLKQLPAVPGGGSSTGSLGDVKIGQGSRKRCRWGPRKP